MRTAHVTDQELRVARDRIAALVSRHPVLTDHFVRLDKEVRVKEISDDDPIARARKIAGKGVTA